MIFYIIFYIVLILFSLVDFTNINIKKKNQLLRCLIIILILFVGLRYKVANDWYNYLNLTKQTESLPDLFQGKSSGFSSESSIEIGFRFLVSIINTFFKAENGQSLQVLTFMVSTFSYLVLYKIVKREPTIKYKFLFISTYVGFTIFREFDILRQVLAFYIFLLSIKYIGVNFKKYLLYNFLGFLFHTSALVFLPLYFVFKLNFNRVFVYLLLSLHCISMFYHFSIVGEILEGLSVYFPELIFVQKIYLLSSEFEGGNTLSLVGILYAIYLLLLIINYSDIKSAPKEKRIFINMFLIFIVVNIIFSDSKEIADRFAYFFYFGLAYIFVLVIDYLPKKIILLYISLVCIFPLIRFNRVIAEPKTRSVIVPYRNYFFVQNSDEDEILSNWENKHDEGLLK